MQRDKEGKMNCPIFRSDRFQVRLPFIHYKIESVEFIQGLILGVTALSAVPHLEQYLGLPYELAWSCVILETMLYLLHSLLGDPVVPDGSL